MKKTGYVVCQTDLCCCFQVFEVKILFQDKSKMCVKVIGKDSARLKQLLLSSYIADRAFYLTHSQLLILFWVDVSDYFSTREAAEKEAEKRNLRLRLKDLEKRVQALEDRNSKGLFGFWSKK